MSTDTQTVAQDAPQVDTADEQTSEASAQAVEAPEASQVQPAEQGTAETEVEAEDTAGEKLYAGKYKSVEDLENAYKNAESKLGQTNSEKAELARVLSDSFVQSAQTDDQTDYTDAQSGVLDQLLQKQSIIEFSMKHPDANGEAVLDILQTDPNINQIGSYDARLEYAYLKSQSMSSQKNIEEAQKKASEQTQAKFIEKQTAQVESAQSSEQTDERSELKERMTSGSLEDREKARREYIRKYLV